MGFDGFAWRLGVRLAALVASAGAAAGLVTFGAAPTAALLATGLAGALAGSLWRLVNAANVDMARFVTALERGDLSQSFAGRGAGFDAVGRAYRAALERVRAERASIAGTARLADALVDGAPTPLLLLGPGDAVAFANKAARALFARSEPSTIAQLAQAHPAFAADLARLAPGGSGLSSLVLDGLAQRVSIDATSIATAAGERRIVAVRIVQTELDRAELAAQGDLVRVLTHEVMNSLTPVTSLAGTASRLVDGLDANSIPDLADARLAIRALARRAAELERFVESYKGFSEAPALERNTIDLRDWFARLAELFAATPAALGASFAWRVGEGVSAVSGDVALLTQVLLNLLKNAGEAAAGAGVAPVVTLAAEPARGGRVRIAVADNGPGVPEGIARDVFLPFFTTKAAGTGIGLSFARQMVLRHGGQIGFASGPGGCVELLLPVGEAAGAA